MNKNLFNKILTLGILVLFIGVGIHPAFAVNTVSFTNKKNEIDVNLFEDINLKEYLFQTIIDISNNQDVKELLDIYKYNTITSDFDYRNIFLQILYKKPNLLISMIFTKPSITNKYLRTTYNIGKELVDLLSDEKVLKIFDDVEIIYPEFFHELNNIIMNNEDLYNRITKLTELNEDNEIICAILCLVYIPAIILTEFFGYIYDLNPTSKIWFIVFYPPLLTFGIISIISIYLLFKFDCFYFGPYRS